MYRILLLLTSGLLFFSCRHADRETKIEIQLNTAWELREVGSNLWLPAHVPGMVSQDIEEYKKHEKAHKYNFKSILKADWEYRTTFDVTQVVLDQDVIELCFKGLETYADVYLNDSLLLKADNKFRSWVASCKPVMKLKDNKLTLYFHHKLKRKKDSLLHHNFLATNPKFLFKDELNKDKDCKHSLSIGVLKPILLRAWSTAKIDELYLKPDSITQKRAVYSINVSLLSIANQYVSLECLVNNKSVRLPINVKLKKGNNNYSTRIVIERPRFWWTNGLGSPNLYNLTVRVRREQEIISEIHQRFGVRTIELVKQSSSPDKTCYFKLNGVPVFIKGATYISDCQNSDLEETQEQTIESARISNFNMLWLKETYEVDRFYDLCDEKGILVWQDFMANSLNLNNDSTYEEIFRQEAIENMKRLRNHPCIALWCGNDMPIADETGNSIVKEYPYGQQLFQEALPKLVKQYSFPIPYLNTSSYIVKPPSGVNLFKGQMIGNLAKGYGVPSQGILNKSNALSDNDFSRFNSEEEQKSLSAYMQNNFNEARDVESKAYISWIAQSEILKSTIENHRINMPKCMGTLYEQLNDCHGNCSLSSIDSSAQWKPAQYAICEAFSHVLVVPVRERNMVNIYVASDALKDLDAILLTKLIDFYGNDIFVKQVPIDIKANKSGILLSVNEKELLKKADITKCCLVVQINQASKTLSHNILYFTELKNLFQPKPAIDFDINEAVTGYNLILRSSVLVKNLVIKTSLKNCWFSDNNFDLLPGKRTKVNIRYNGTKAELEKSIRFISIADIK